MGIYDYNAKFFMTIHQLIKELVNIHHLTEKLHFILCYDYSSIN